ncbi:MAG: 16S rRNA (guanine(527)-N(7))-methyltransferase RsmG [Ruthenibacterium sp.]
MIDKNRLIEKAARYGIDAAPIADALDTYASLLVEYTKKVNLTAIVTPEGIEDRHFIDSLLLAAQPEVRGRLVDVGTGAGFPGIVAKLYRPELSLTLMEPTGKRVEFLRFVCAELGLSHVEFAKERAEEAARKIWREQFDAVCARAVADMAMLSEYCLPLVRVGGVFLAMKGSGAADELAAARGAVKKLGGICGDRRDFTLPDGSARSILLCRKISQTPSVYPRNGGKIAKAPLQ